MAVESSEDGLKLYERSGFKTVQRAEMEYKGEVLRWPVMVREPESLPCQI